MRLWPILCGVNLWLVALVVPLLLAARTASPLLWAMAPLAPLCLAVGLRQHQTGYGQFMLFLGVPLLALLPGTDGALSDPRFSPRPAVWLTIALFLGYLTTLCRFLAREVWSSRPADWSLSQRQATPAAQKNQAWQLEPWTAKIEPPRLFRRILAHRLLTLYTVAVPLLVLYAVDIYPANLFALRAFFGAPRRVAAVQTMLSAGLLILCSVNFYFCIMSPLASYLDHHRVLRADLHAMRRQARRGRPRRRLYAYMLGALLSMILLIIWSLRR